MSIGPAVALAYQRSAEDLAALGGILRCPECGTQQPLGDVAAYLRSGWPKCCGFTMRWIIQQELDEWRPQ